MPKAMGCVLTLLAMVVVIGCSDGGGTNSGSPTSPSGLSVDTGPSSLPFDLSGTSSSGELPFNLSSADGEHKVSLCHVTGNGSYHLINVDKSAEPAHLGHGDGKPGEEVPNEPPLLFDEQCGIPRPEVDIEKATNDEDADEAPGPEIIIVEGEDTVVVWTYVVTNTGDFPLSNVVVTDNIEGVITCPANMLAVDQSMTCTAEGIAAEGQYTNVATVTADADDELFAQIPMTVTDSDASHYLGIDPDAVDEPGEKVTLCHRTGQGRRYILIEVSINAEPAHLTHGDGYPGGPVPLEPGKTFGANCSVS